MPLPTGPTVPIKFQKAISSLPGTLTPDSLYAVRVGDGFDLYVSDMTGNIAFKSNSPSSLTVSRINSQNTITNSIQTVSAIRFDTGAGFSVTDLGSGAAKIGLTPINFISGTGVIIDNNTATNSVTISSAVAASANLIKTFNILNNFQAPLIGSSIFVPSYTDFVRGIVMVNAGAVGTDLTVGLYRNGELLNFFTLTAGNFKAVFSGFEYQITPSDYITVSVVAGQGLNFNLALLNSSPT